MRWLAIINPLSGGGKTDSELRRIRSSVQAVAARCAVTEYPGHAEKLTREASGFDGIAVVGGDGTLHEVLRGLHQEQVLGIVPAGTGNSLARDLSLERTASALASIASGNWIPIDLMHVIFKDKMGARVERVSASTIALGYPTAATLAANRYFKGLGKLCYPVAATFETGLLRHFLVQLQLGRAHRQAKSLTGLIINNTRHIANFLAFPNASLNDGKIEIMELDAGCWKQIAHNLAILSRRDFCSPASLQRAPSLSVDLASPQHLMIDGEIYSDVTGLQVQVLPRRLRCSARSGIDS